jgi:hypothetical protein
VIERHHAADDWAQTNVASQLKFEPVKSEIAPGPTTPAQGKKGQASQPLAKTPDPWDQSAAGSVALYSGKKADDGWWGALRARSMDCRPLTSVECIAGTVHNRFARHAHTTLPPLGGSTHTQRCALGPGTERSIIDLLSVTPDF